MELAQKIKVLIADDDAPTRILLRAAIVQWGYEVVESKDGEEAWDIMQKPDAPRLMIVDWLMPKLNGIDLCERLKKQMPYYIYIILLTQQSGTTNLIKGLEAGADEFLSKPFNMAELRSRLSIGARIVNYEKDILKQNEMLTKYISDIEVSTKAALESIPTGQTEAVKNQLMTIIETIKKYRDDHKIKA